MYKFSELSEFWETYRAVRGIFAANHKRLHTQFILWMKHIHAGTATAEEGRDLVLESRDRDFYPCEMQLLTASVGLMSKYEDWAQATAKARRAREEAVTQAHHDVTTAMSGWSGQPWMVSGTDVICGGALICTCAEPEDARRLARLRELATRFVSTGKHVRDFWVEDSGNDFDRCCDLSDIIQEVEELLGEDDNFVGPY